MIVSTIPAFIPYANSSYVKSISVQSNVQCVYTNLSFISANLSVISFTNNVQANTLNTAIILGQQSQLGSNTLLQNQNLQSNTTILQSNLNNVYNTFSQIFSTSKTQSINLSLVYANLNPCYINLNFITDKIENINSTVVGNSLSLESNLYLFSTVYSNITSNIANAQANVWNIWNQLYITLDTNYGKLAFCNVEFTTVEDPAVKSNLSLIYSNVSNLYSQCLSSHYTNILTTQNVTTILSNMNYVYSNLSNQLTWLSNSFTGIGVSSYVYVNSTSDRLLLNDSNIYSLASNVSNLQISQFELSNQFNIYNIYSNVLSIQSNISNLYSQITPLQYANIVNYSNILLTQSNLNNTLTWFSNIDSSFSLANLRLTNILYKDLLQNISSNVSNVFSNLTKIQISHTLLSNTQNYIESNIRLYEANISVLYSNIRNLQISNIISSTNVTSIQSNVNLVYANISSTLYSNLFRLQAGNIQLYANISNLTNTYSNLNLKFVNIWSNISNLVTQTGILNGLLSSVTANIYSNGQYINKKLLTLDFGSRGDSNIYIQGQSVSTTIMFPILISDANSIICSVNTLPTDITDNNNIKAIIDIRKNNKSIYDGVIDTTTSYFTKSPTLIIDDQAYNYAYINSGSGVTFWNGKSQVFNRGDVLSAVIIGNGTFGTGSGGTGAKVNILYSQL